jgi:hypothetical protein
MERALSPGARHGRVRSGRRHHHRGHRHLVELAHVPAITSGTAFIAAALTIGCHRGSIDYRHRRAQAVLDSCGGHLAIGIKCLIAAKPPISW